jgi:hypothetical protein
MDIPSELNEIHQSLFYKNDRLRVLELKKFLTENCYLPETIAQLEKSKIAKQLAEQLPLLTLKELLKKHGIK